MTGIADMIRDKKAATILAVAWPLFVAGMAWADLRGQVAQATEVLGTVQTNRMDVVRLQSDYAHVGVAIDDLKNLQRDQHREVLQAIAELKNSLHQYSTGGIPVGAAAISEVMP